MLFVFALDAFHIRKPAAEIVIETTLIPHDDPALSEIRRRIHDRDDEKKEEPLHGLPPLVGGEKADRLFERVRLASRDQKENQALRRIRKKMEEAWEQAQPDSWGRLLMVMEIAPDGSVLQAGVNKLSGKEGFEDFVYAVVQAASPFSDAMEGKTDSLWIELEFVVDAAAAKEAGDDAP